MTSLLRAELLRLFSRRVARILAGIAVLIALLVTVRAFVVSDRDLAAARARATAQADRIERDQVRYQREALQDCERRKATGEILPGIDCAEAVGGVEPGFSVNPDDIYQDPRLFARDALPTGATAVAVFVAFISIVVGASFIGADWNHGTLQALLFWEPRRGRVLLAKAVALVTGVVAFSAVLQLLVYGMLLLTASTRGSMEGVTAGLQVSVLLTVLRGMFAASVMALIGYALAGLARYTVAALGAAFGYVLLENLLLVPLRPGWERYLPTRGIAAILAKKIPVAPAHPGSLSRVVSGELQPYQLTGVRGAVTLAVYLGILLGAFYVSFTRRDVT